MLLIFLCRWVVVLLCEYVCKYLLFISLQDVLWSFYVSMFVSICYLFLFADVLWSFNVSMFVSICYLFPFADVLWSFYVSMFVSICCLFLFADV